MSEYCEYWGSMYGQWISPSTMYRGLKRLGLTKKKRFLGSQADPDQGQKLRGEYWEKVKNLEPENGVYILLLKSSKLRSSRSDFGNLGKKSKSITYINFVLVTLFTIKVIPSPPQLFFFES